MCGGGKGGDGGAAAARAEEAARQQKIREGTDKINMIFDGGSETRVVNPLSLGDLLSPGAKVYKADGTELTVGAGTAPTVGTGLNKRQANIVGYRELNGTLVPVYDTQLGHPKAAAASLKQLITPDKLFGGVETTYTPGQFNDEFFTGRRQAYIDYAQPQINDQYSDAQKQLTYALDRSGMLNSSVRAEKEAELERIYNQNVRNVLDQALGYEASARSNVEDARANLIAMLNSTADVQGAVNAAMARAKALSAPEPFSPIGQAFAGFTGTLARQAENAKLQNLSSSGGSPVSYYNNARNSVRNR